MGGRQKILLLVAGWAVFAFLRCQDRGASAARPDGRWRDEGAAEMKRAWSV